MITLNDLQKNRRTVAVATSVGDLTVAYKPAVFTPAWFEAMADKPLGEALADLLASWDLMDGEAAVPITATDIAAKVPSWLQTAVWEAVREDMGKLTRAA